MTDAGNIEPETRPDWKPRKKRGPGKPGPEVVLSTSNMGPFAYTEKKRIGRPSTYTEKKGAYICQQLALGRGLISILDEEGMPDRVTLYNWLSAIPEFDSQYLRARAIGWDVYAEKLVSRSIDVPPELAQSRKLEIDTGKWILSKLAARKYGDRIAVDQQVTGTVSVDVVITQQLLTPANIAKLSEAELDVWQQALATIPKLLAPPGPQSFGDTVIDAVAVSVEPGEDEEGQPGD